MDDPDATAGEPSGDSFRTEDIATAEAVIRRIYPVAKLREARRRFWFEQTSRGADGVTFARFKISTWVDIAVEFEEVAAYGLVLGGRYAARSGDTDLDTSRPFAFRPGPGSSESEHLDLLMVNIDIDTLSSAAARRLGVEDVRIDLTRTSPASEALRQHWTRTVAYAWQSVVQVPEVFHNDLTRMATFDAVVAAALATFPVDVLHPGRLPNDRALTAAIRRARRYIEDHPDQPLRIEQIARQAGTSVRSLQNAFRRELEITPLGYLRRIRLIHARDDLLDAEPGEVTVGDVARRWGFVNLGRFAAEYQALFGEKPSWTLRR